MGYFSNGSEGDWYRHKYCERCIHNPDNDSALCCPVWFIHLEHNYTQLNAGNEMLKEAMDLLIPRDGKTGVGQCRMFVEKKGE